MKRNLFAYPSLCVGLESNESRNCRRKPLDGCLPRVRSIKTDLTRVLSLPTCYAFCFDSLPPLLDPRRPVGIIKNGRCSSQLTLRDFSRPLSAARSRLDALCTVISSINGCANCAEMGSRIHVCRSGAIVDANDVLTVPAVRGTVVYDSSGMNQLCSHFLL